MATLVAMIGRYFRQVLPVARRELRGWERAAKAIPDRSLRAHALATLGDEALLAEAAALFAVLAPPTQRDSVVRLTVAFQVLYDYLDTLGERPGCESLDRGRRLYRLLDGTLVEGQWAMDDGGYVERLTETCRTALWTLPAALVAFPALLRATRRCADGQALTHAAAGSGPEALRRWSLAQDPAAACEWWETAGGAISSLGVHALFAAAADPDLTNADAERIDHAYFPWVCALSTLLDSLIDRYGPDAESERPNHSVLDYYSSERVAAQRVAWIARRAVSEARGLGSNSHVVIVAGVAAWYLSSHEARRPANATIARAVREALGSLLSPLMAVLWLRRLVG